MPDQR